MGTSITAWSAIVAIIGVALLVSLMMWAVGQTEIRRRLEAIRKRFLCPVKGQEVEVNFLVRVGEPGNLLGVKSCSAFKEGEEMDCDRSCVYLPQAQAAPPLPQRA